MKAIYQSPKTDIISISLQLMVFQSNLEEGQNLDESPETEATEGNLSRRHRRSVWDEWEDEEEDF